MQQAIEEDIKSALRAGDRDKVAALKLLKAAIQMAAIKAQNKLDDEQVAALLQKELKKRNEAAMTYEQGGAQELADKERYEAALIQAYLPEGLSEEALLAIVRETIAARPDLNKGQMIGEVMKAVKGRAEGRAVAALVNKELAA